MLDDHYNNKRPANDIQGAGANVSSGIDPNVRPGSKHYKVPGHEKYEVVIFRPLFPNWRERVFLYKDGRYFDQASGEYPVEVRVTKDDEVRIVKTGPSMGRPIGSPRPRGGY